MRTFGMALVLAGMALAGTAYAQTVTKPDADPAFGVTVSSPFAQKQQTTTDFAAFVRLAGFSNLLEVRQSGQKRRIEIASDALVQTFIEDRENGALALLTASFGKRLAYIFPMPAQAGAVPLPLDFEQLKSAQRLMKLGARNMAGTPCDLYRFIGFQDMSGDACVAKQGIVLFFQPDGRTTPLFQVERIVFQPQDEKHFKVPELFQRVDLPGIGGQGFIDDGVSGPSSGNGPVITNSGTGGQATITILDGEPSAPTTRFTPVPGPPPPLAGEE